jgi:ribonuclease Z
MYVLGTGFAMATKCFNTCFYLETEKGLFLTDAGGGNGILRQLEETPFKFGDCHHMFVTHGHTDHVLGVIWVMRKVADLMNKGKYEGQFHIYCHDVVKDMLIAMTKMTLKKKDFARVGTDILVHEVQDGESVELPFANLTAFDICSTKAKQFGYRLVFPDGMKFVCLGDEPYNEHDREYAAGADWLLAEAFCRYEDREVFQPYEKNHSTVKEASELAEELKAKNLVLYHTEDKHIATRKQDYSAEAAKYYGGKIFVPDDLDAIAL